MDLKYSVYHLMCSKIPKCWIKVWIVVNFSVCHKRNNSFILLVATTILRFINSYLFCNQSIQHIFLVRELESILCVYLCSVYLSPVFSSRTPARVLCLLIREQTLDAVEVCYRLIGQQVNGFPCVQGTPFAWEKFLFYLFNPKSFI